MTEHKNILATTLSAETAGDTKLFTAFANGNDDFVTGLVGRFALDAGRWKTRLGEETSIPAALAEYVESFNASLGAGDSLIDRLRMACRGEARFVVTGQQPGALGGPLMALHKAAAAVSLARVLESRTGVAFVPLFWVGSDDTDFAEIREAVIPGKDLRPLVSTIETEDHEVGLPVGSISNKAIGRLWNALRPFAAAHDNGDFVASVVDDAVGNGKDHGDVAARIVASLFTDELVLVDGRASELREATRDLILNFFDREPDIKQLVIDQGAELEEHGYHAQVRPGPDSGVFVVDDGIRHTVTDVSRAEVRARFARDITAASPGVILRNLIQDAAFRPVAVVLGPAEVAYRAQMRGVYAALGVPSPVAFPRLFGTFVPPRIADVIRESDLDPSVLATDVKAFMRSVVDTCSDPAAIEAADHFRRSFGARSKEFLDTAGATMPQRERDKLEKRIEDVSRRLHKVLEVTQSAGMARALEKWPFLEGAQELFARKGAPQERYLSMLSPFLFGGESARQAVTLAAQTHVEGALDGRLRHVVYST